LRLVDTTGLDEDSGFWVKASADNEDATSPVVTEVRELEWGTGLLLLVQVVLLLGLAEEDTVTLDPLTGGTPIFSFGPVMN
jgi:hypothetical protein